MSIDTTYLRRCIVSLENALAALVRSKGDQVMYDVCRSACVKEFELVLEQSGKLLRRSLAEYFASNRQADRLVFKDLFRHAAKHCLLESTAVERWLRYRDNRNNTAHNYGEHFANFTLKMLPSFILDAKELANRIEGIEND